MNRQAAPPRTVHFDIDRITVHGYSPGQRTRFVSSLRRHLTELAADRSHEWPPGGERRVGHLDAGPLDSGALPEEAARRIAVRVLAAAGRTAWRGDS